MRIQGSKDDLLNDRINSHFLPFTRLLILDTVPRNVPGDTRILNPGLQDFYAWSLSLSFSLSRRRLSYI